MCVPHVGMNDPKEEEGTPELSPCHVRTQQDDASRKPGRQLSPATESASTFVLDFQPPEQ